MGPQRLVAPTFVSVFVLQTLEFTTIELPPVCFQPGETFEVTVREERHSNGNPSRDLGGRGARHNGGNGPLVHSADKTAASRYGRLTQIKVVNRAARTDAP